MTEVSDRINQVRDIIYAPGLTSMERAKRIEALYVSASPAVPGVTVEQHCAGEDGDTVGWRYVVNDKLSYWVGEVSRDLFENSDCEALGSDFGIYLVRFDDAAPAGERAVILAKCPDWERGQEIAAKLAAAPPPPVEDGETATEETCDEQLVSERLKSLAPSSDQIDADLAVLADAFGRWRAAPPSEDGGLNDTLAEIAKEQGKTSSDVVRNALAKMPRSDGQFEIVATPPAAPVAEREALTEKDVKLVVAQAMQDTWNDYCADAEAFPPDIHVSRGPRVHFTAHTWADWTGAQVYRDLKAALRSAPATVGEVSAPMEVADLINRVYLPSNPNKMRNAHPDVLAAVTTFKQALQQREG